MFALGDMGNQQATLKEHDRSLADMRKRISKISAERKKAEDKLLELQAPMELTCRELTEELSRVQGDLKLVLEEKSGTKAELEQERIAPMR